MNIEVTQEVKDYVTLIDTKYRQAKEKELSRMSVEWGKWSRKMNLEVREKSKEEYGPQYVLFRYIFMYWVNRSELLELHYQHKYKKGLKKQTARRGKHIKQIILSGDAPDAISDDDMIQALLKR